MYFRRSGVDTRHVHESIHVLVADDHPVHQAMHRALLEGLGCTVEIASDGFEAVRMANDAPFDLIIMDRHMPACSGDQATLLIRAFRGLYKNVVIFCCSTDVPLGSDAAIYDGVVPKPATSAGIAGIVETVRRNSIERAA